MLLCFFLLFLVILFQLFSVIVDSSSTKRENTLKRSFNTAVAGDGGAPITAAQLLKEMKPTPSYSSGILSENSLKLQPTSTLLSAPAPKIALRASDSVVSAPDVRFDFHVHCRSLLLISPFVAKAERLQRHSHLGQLRPQLAQAFYL